MIITVARWYDYNILFVIIVQNKYYNAISYIITDQIMGVDIIFKMGVFVISACELLENFYPIVFRTLKYALKIGNLLL